MPRIAYVNGRYVAHREASVHIEDRGYQFADGVYEVVPVFNGRLVDEEPHLDRLDYSLRRTQDRPAMFARRSAIYLSRAAAAERSAARHPLYAGHPRCCAAGPQVPRRSEIGARGDHKELWRSCGADDRRGRPGHHHPRYPLGPLRYQVGVAAAQRAWQATGGGAGRLRSLDGGPRRQCHRRHVDQFLDCHGGQARDHPAAQRRDSCRHHPRFPVQAHRRGQLQTGGEAISLWPRRRPPPRLSSPAARRWCCR